jgi:hypothetical protein
MAKEFIHRAIEGLIARRRFRCLRPTWSLRRRCNWWRSKSLPNPGTTGRADWSGSTKEGPRLPSLQPSMSPMYFSSQSQRMEVSRTMKNNRNAEDDAALTPGSHKQLWQIVVKLPTDVEPWGQREPGEVGNCPCSCRWFLRLWPCLWIGEHVPTQRVPASRLLTFEHQGCPQFEEDSLEMDRSE